MTPSSKRAGAVRASAVSGLNVGGALGGAPAPVQPRFAAGSVLPLVSSAVESSATLAKFESFAGRSAMVSGAAGGAPRRGACDPRR